MKVIKAMEVLEDTKRQFEASIDEAELGEKFALDAQDDNEEAVEALKMAIKALEKQIPMKVIREDGVCPYCPVCCSAEWVENLDENENNYCGQCGQKLDWE